MAAAALATATPATGPIGQPTLPRTSAMTQSELLMRRYASLILTGLVAFAAGLIVASVACCVVGLTGE